MKRREFICLLGGAVIALPRGVKAQGAAKRPLVAVLLAGSSLPPATSLSQDLRELGYVEGQNVDVVYRYAEGDNSRMPALAEELVRLKPDVLVTSTVVATFALKWATATIPIVNVSLTDPEGFGFIESMSRPAGQVTGISSLACSVSSFVTRPMCHSARMTHSQASRL
jgi:putative ABC transport system substrate-binding protein